MLQLIGWDGNRRKVDVPLVLKRISQHALGLTPGPNAADTIGFVAKKNSAIPKICFGCQAVRPVTITGPARERVIEPKIPADSQNRYGDERPQLHRQDLNENKINDRWFGCNVAFSLLAFLHASQWCAASVG